MAKHFGVHVKDAHRAAVDAHVLSQTAPPLLSALNVTPEKLFASNSKSVGWLDYFVKGEPRIGGKVNEVDELYEVCWTNLSRIRGKFMDKG